MKIRILGMAVYTAVSCCYGHVLLLGLDLAVHCSYSSSAFNSHPYPHVTRLWRSTWRLSSLHAPLFPLLEASEEQYMLSAAVVDKIAEAYLQNAAMAGVFWQQGHRQVGKQVLRFWSV